MLDKISFGLNEVVYNYSVQFVKTKSKKQTWLLKLNGDTIWSMLSRYLFLVTRIQIDDRPGRTTCRSGSDVSRVYRSFLRHLFNSRREEFLLRFRRRFRGAWLRRWCLWLGRKAAREEGRGLNALRPVFEWLFSWNVMLIMLYRRLSHDIWKTINVQIQIKNVSTSIKMVSNRNRASCWWIMR